MYSKFVSVTVWIKRTFGRAYISSKDRAIPTRWSRDPDLSR